MKCVITNFANMATGESCRMDAKYNCFVGPCKWSVFVEKDNTQPLSEVLLPIPIKKMSKGELKETCLLINISEQIAASGELVLSEDSYVSEINSDKNILTDCDIMISKLGMSRGYIYLMPKQKINSEIIGSSEFIPYKFNDKDTQSFYLYLLLLPQMRSVYSSLETGKTPSHKRVNPNEFLRIQIPKIEKEIAIAANKKIEDIISEISKLKTKIQTTQSIIDYVFNEYFQLDEDFRKQLRKGMTYGTQSSENTRLCVYNAKFICFGREKGLRFSTRSQNPIFKSLESSIKERGYRKISEIIKENTHRGKSPQYDASGEVSVVKTAHLKNGEIIISTEEFVTKEFYNSKPLAHVKKGDILIASTGKPSIGKVDLVDKKIDLFADGHVSILRIDQEKYDSQFLVYYLWSVLGSFQIEREYVGSTNQIEIYPEQIDNFLVPDISIVEQRMIVDKIQVKLMSQEKIKRKLRSLRENIDNIIIKVIKS